MLVLFPKQLNLRVQYHHLQYMSQTQQPKSLPSAILKPVTILTLPA